MGPVVSGQFAITDRTLRILFDLESAFLRSIVSLDEPCAYASPRDSSHAGTPDTARGSA